MNTNTLTPSQLCLIETLSRVVSQQEADELSRIIRDYYAKKLDEELESLWNDKTFDQQKLDELKKEHLRTRYKA